MDYKQSFNKWLAATDSEELKAIKDNDSEIKERFYSRLGFGTAGMRGVVALGTARMNNYTVAAATLGLAKYIVELKAEARGVAIAYDTRRCSKDFALVSARVLSANGIKVFLFENVRPVPIISFTVRHTGAIAGIMITASHNPKEYNGYKVYGEDGAQMSPDATAIVVSYIDKVDDYFNIDMSKITIKSLDEAAGWDNQKIDDNITIIGESVDKEYYARIMKLCLSPDEVKANKDSLKIVYTPIHGSGYKPVTTVLSMLDIPYTVVEEQAMPDTEFSTVSVPNPEQKDALLHGIALAEKIGANVVIGTDPDCDRMGVAVKYNGEFMLLTGNQIGALLMDYILGKKQKMGILPNNAAVVKTIVTTGFAAKIAASYNTKIFDVLTGFKFIGEKIKEWEQSGEYEFQFGYEESYGYLCGTHARDKDAVVASMMFAEMVCYLKSEGKEVYEHLLELYEKHGFYKDMSVSIAFKGLDGMAKMASIMEKLHKNPIFNIGGEKVEFISDYDKRTTFYKDGSTKAITLPRTNAIYYGLKGGNWLCVRPSGTEPKLKIYVSIQGASMTEATDKANYLIEEMKKTL